MTPFLLHRGLPPRFAIGSVNTAEVAVRGDGAAVQLLASLGSSDLDIGIILAMLIGGVLAAPLAAYVIRFLPPRGLGVAVAGLLMITNLHVGHLDRHRPGSLDRLQRGRRGLPDRRPRPLVPRPPRRHDRRRHPGHPLTRRPPSFWRLRCALERSLAPPERGPLCSGG